MKNYLKNYYTNIPLKKKNMLTSNKNLKFTSLKAM